MTNATAIKFGYPESLIAESAHWQVLVRPAQPTLGSLVLVCKDPATAFGQIAPAAFADLGQVVAAVERVLGDAVAFEKINYLMLMMVDRDVHFHVIPRYDGERRRDGLVFADAGWPGQPALDKAVALDPDQIAAFARDLSQNWTSSGA